MKLLIVAASLALPSLALLVAHPARAESEGDGNWLLHNCGAAATEFDMEQLAKRFDRIFANRVDPMSMATVTTCIYYIKGVTDWAVFWTKGHEPYCIANVPKSEVVRVVVKGLSDNPEKLRWPAMILVTEILTKAFPPPCNKQK